MSPVLVYLVLGPLKVGGQRTTYRSCFSPNVGLGGDLGTQVIRLSGLSTSTLTPTKPSCQPTFWVLEVYLVLEQIQSIVSIGGLYVVQCT